MPFRFPRCLLALLGAAAVGSSDAYAQSLQVTYGSKGVQTIVFNGVTLENTGVYSADIFHIWHMKATDLSGNVLSTGQYGWGETNSGEAWNSQTNTEAYTFTWGSISTQFVQSGDVLNMIVTETNNAGSGIKFDGAEIYPFTLHFPVDPAGFNGYTQHAITTTDPGISVADFGSGVVTTVLPDESMPLYTGWKVAGSATYSPIMTSTSPDGLATFLPHNDLPLAPGSTLSYTVSLRFTPEGTAANVSDATTSFAQTYPNQMTWADKRILGTAYLASSPTSNGDNTQPGGFPTNPRRYFNDSTVDITTASGLQSFQDRMLAQAASQVTNAHNLHAQAVITWDIEGEEYPQSTSYVCSPDQIATVAPEMESTITDKTSAYYGQKLDDAYFKAMTSAGLRVGVCIRPQVFTLGANGTASQISLSTDAAIIANLENKARFANTRWGVTMLYVDSVVDVNGGTLDPAIFEQVSKDLPSFLFMPEEFTTRYYAYTAPFYSFIFHTTTGTAASVREVYPKAFGANLVNDVNAATLATYTPQLTAAVENGDILMGHADYWQENDPTLVAIYTAAGVTTPSSPLSTPAVNWSTPTSITYGTALSGSQLDASSSVAGTFSYSPAAGTVLSVGTHTLDANFAPTDTSAYRNASASVQLTVSQATPKVSWSTPVGIAAGTALSSAQLDAEANVPGTFTYQPAAGTVLSAGNNVLSVTFTPSDSVDYKPVTATTVLTVSAANVPRITWPTPGAITYGTPLSATQLNATANVAGTFKYSLPAGTVLHAGNNNLAVSFTPQSSAYEPTTKAVTLTVNKAIPELSWRTPAAVSSGTPLSATQLDATASVPGAITYVPGAGEVLKAGNNTLTASFTPEDSADYTGGSATVSLTVTNPSTPSGPVALLSPAAGASLSGDVVVTARVNVNLDAAGSLLLADGNPVQGTRVTGAPYLYPLNTALLSNGVHVLQIWTHDINNTVTLSQPVTITVQN